MDSYRRIALEMGLSSGISKESDSFVEKEKSQTLVETSSSSRYLQRNGQFRELHTALFVNYFGVILICNHGTPDEKHLEHRPIM